MTGDAAVYLLKAQELLAVAESEYAAGRHQNCANRAYDACYQAAVAAPIDAGIRPKGPRWGHDTVQAVFMGELVNRRKLFPGELRDTFDRLVGFRETADDEVIFVSEVQAARALRRARSFVRAVVARGEFKP